ncbi:Crp/Fnr family transcriptional regulator [Chryseobacterium sp.]|uniref:Crp/Fnr family transcriptional regulator n=1 Tax=Chryseobacterium sp. TaxID=1871047 RepID=UPI0025C66259|nr:Crp/Fnr family transcriptional regulator [Chryseobacterium sp.]
METFFAHILKNIEGLTLEEISGLSEYMNFRTIPAGENYIEEGDFDTKFFYIKKGLFRIFCLFENGEEKTILFRWESCFMGNYDGIIYKKPSRFFYQALEEVELLEMDYSVLESYLNKNLNLSNIRSNVMLSMIGDLLRRNENFILLNPEERYRRRLEENEAIINRVPSKYLASLLGVTPVSLSRIKKRIFKGN